MAHVPLVFFFLDLCKFFEFLEYTEFVCEINNNIRTLICNFYNVLLFPYISIQKNSKLLLVDILGVSRIFLKTKFKCQVGN